MPVTDMIIRESSLALVLKVHNTVFEFESEPNEKYFSDRLANHDRLVLVTSIGKKHVGYLLGYDRDQDGSFYFWMAGVDPNYRRMGIMTELMKYQEAWAKAHGYTSLKVEIHNQRPAMLINVINSGFKALSTEQIRDPEEFSIHFQKQLT